MRRHRIDTTKETDTWGYCCPECGSENWRAIDGSFECRGCNSNLGGLEHKPSGEVIPRERIEFVGPHASWKAPYADRGRR
jgi:ribosomal protein L37AE/L43A